MAKVSVSDAKNSKALSLDRAFSIASLVQTTSPSIMVVRSSSHSPQVEIIVSKRVVLFSGSIAGVSAGKTSMISFLLVTTVTS